MSSVMAFVVSLETCDRELQLRAKPGAKTDSVFTQPRARARIKF